MIGCDSRLYENAALIEAMQLYALRTNHDDDSAITNFLRPHRNSPWRGAFLLNVGLDYRESGWLLKAFAVWEGAWELSKDSTEPKAKALADRIFGELVDLSARVGRLDQVEGLLGQPIDGKPYVRPKQPARNLIRLDHKRSDIVRGIRRIPGKQLSKPVGTIHKRREQETSPRHAGNYSIVVLFVS